MYGEGEVCKVCVEGEVCKVCVVKVRSVRCVCWG